MHGQSVTYLVCLFQLIFPDDPALPHKHSEIQGKDRGGGVRKPEFKSGLGHSVICTSQSLQTKNEEAGSGFVEVSRGCVSMNHVYALPCQGDEMHRSHWVMPSLSGRSAMAPHLGRSENTGNFTIGRSFA